MYRSFLRLRLGAWRLFWRLERVGRKLLGLKRTTYLEDRVGEYRTYWQEAAKKLQASFEPIAVGGWEIRQGIRRTRIASHLIQIDDPVILRLAANKPYCLGLAEKLGIPIAPHRVFRLGEVDWAWRFIAERGGAYVVKPAVGTGAARGTTMHVCTRLALERAAGLASLYSETIMVEAMVPSESCRLLYLDGELIHAVRRRGVRIVGDGRSSIRHLLIGSGLKHLIADPGTLATLNAQDITMESGLPEGKELVVRYLPPDQPVTPELRTVYNECITALVCSELELSLGRLVAELGSRFAGVDVVTNDPRVPLAESRGVFLEVNTTPAIHHHYIGQQYDSVADRILRYLLSHSM